MQKTELSYFVVVSSLMACLSTIVIFSLQLGFYRATIQHNSLRLDTIERHDVETRDIESKLIERISRLEAMCKP